MENKYNKPGLFNKWNGILLTGRDGLHSFHCFLFKIIIKKRFMLIEFRENIKKQIYIIF